MTREWKHLKMMKRAGRGHDPTGVRGTQVGELAVECPACPQIGKNLPDNWKDAPEDQKYVQSNFLALFSLIELFQRFLYWLFVSLDACFRVKRYDVSDEKTDPILDDGLAYFVPNGPYKEQVKKYKNQAAVGIRQFCSARLWAEE